MASCDSLPFARGSESGNAIYDETPLSVGSKSLSGSGMSKVAMQTFRLSVEISEKHVVPFAVYRQCNNPRGARPFRHLRRRLAESSRRLHPKGKQSQAASSSSNGEGANHAPTSYGRGWRGISLPLKAIVPGLAPARRPHLTWHAGDRRAAESGVGVTDQLKPRAYDARFFV
jgi:hypothetical protein